MVDLARPASISGAGLPPRYYLPQVSLPPPEPLAAAAPGRQPARRLGEGAETWVASPDWAEAFGEWPPVDPERLGEDTDLVAPGVPAADTVVAAAETRAGAERADPGELTELAEPPWLAPPLPSAEAPRAGVAGGGRAPRRPPRAAFADDEPNRRGAIPPAGGAASPRASSQLARHRVDPFAPAPGGRFRRRREGDGVVEVPPRTAARPTRRRLQPELARRAERR